MSNYLDNKSMPTLGNAVLRADALAIPFDNMNWGNALSIAAQRELPAYFGQMNEAGKEPQSA